MSLTWPEDGWYEAGTVNHTNNYNAIFSWCKLAKVDPHSTWALEVRSDKVMVHQWALNEAGERYLVRKKDPVGGEYLDVARKEGFEVEL